MVFRDGKHQCVDGMVAIWRVEKPRWCRDSDAEIFGQLWEAIATSGLELKSLFV
jgi:hypothetical protein